VVVTQHASSGAPNGCTTSPHTRTSSYRSASRRPCRPFGGSVFICVLSFVFRNARRRMVSAG